MAARLQALKPSFVGRVAIRGPERDEDRLASLGRARHERRSPRTEAERTELVGASGMPRWAEYTRSLMWPTEGRKSSGAQTVVAARSARMGQHVRSTASLRNVEKSIAEGMAGACNAATEAAGRSIDVPVGERRMEVRHNVGGCGGSSRTGTPGAHASSRELLGGEEHVSGADPVRRSTG